MPDMGMGTSGGSCTPGQVLFCDELAWFLYLNLGRFAFSVSLTFDDRQVPSEKDCDLSIVKRGKRVGLAPRRILHVRPVRKLGSGVFHKCPDSLLDKIERSDRALLLERSGHANRESPLVDVSKRARENGSVRPSLWVFIRETLIRFCKNGTVAAVKQLLGFRLVHVDRRIGGLAKANDEGHHIGTAKFHANFPSQQIPGNLIIKNNELSCCG